MVAVPGSSRAAVPARPALVRLTVPTRPGTMPAACAAEVESRLFGELPERVDESRPERRAVVIARAARTVVVPGIAIPSIVVRPVLLGTILIDDAFFLVIVVHVFVVHR